MATGLPCFPAVTPSIYAINRHGNPGPGYWILYNGNSALVKALTAVGARRGRMTIILCPIKTLRINSALYSV